jgi:hypothetical protein
MTAGVPGFALSGLFYLITAFLMPIIELVRTVQGRSSVLRWRLVLRHTLLASTMVMAIGLTFQLVLEFVLPLAVETGPQPLAELAPRLLFVGTWAFLLTVAVLGTMLLTVEVARYLVRRPRGPASATLERTPA